MEIHSEELENLFRYYASTESLPQAAREASQLQIIQDRCNIMFSRDYKISLLDNSDLCPTYPLQIILVVGQLDLGVNVEGGEESVQNNTTEAIIQNQMLSSKDCRTRSRFPVPVININGKNICRSAGLVEKAEMMYKKAKTTDLKGLLYKGIHTSKYEARNLDITWLKMLKIRYIIDLMNEKKRTFMGVVPLCSGEVASLDYYKEFSLNSMPFPGVNAYKGFKEEGENYVRLPERRRVKETESVATLELSTTYQLPHTFGNWDMYRSWDIVQLLQNYLRYIFHLLRNGTNQEGLLVHCISGWDRTPMFIGILRILLWAEGLIHKSMDIDQMLFLVVGYDWLLFGHQLHSRLKAGAQILYFAFWVLQHLLDDEFSLQGALSNISNEPKTPKDETEEPQTEKGEKSLWIRGLKGSKEISLNSPVISPRKKLGLDATENDDGDDLRGFDDKPYISSPRSNKKSRSERSSPRGANTRAELKSSRRITGAEKKSLQINFSDNCSEIVSEPEERKNSNEREDLEDDSQENYEKIPKEKKKKKKGKSVLEKEEKARLKKEKKEHKNKEKRKLLDKDEKGDKLKLKSHNQKKKKEKKNLVESFPEEKHKQKKNRYEKKEEIEVHFEVHVDDMGIPKLTRNTSLPDLGILLSNKKRGEKSSSRSSRDGKSPRRATRDTVGKSPQRSLRESTKSPPKQREFELEKVEIFEPPNLKANNERQQKIIDLWLKFSEIYKNTIEQFH